MVNGEETSAFIHSIFTIHHLLLNDAAPRSLDEAEQFFDLLRALQLFADARKRLRGVQLRGEEEAEGMVQGFHRLLRVAAALHADGVEAVALRVVADGEREGERVLDDDRVAADVRLAADAAELVDSGVGA